MQLVFAFLKDYIDSQPTPPFHRELLQLHVEEAHKLAEVPPGLPAVRLPLLVHAAVRGDPAPAIPLAAACLLVFLGADLLDNVMDDELPDRWHGRSTDAVLAAATYLSALPTLATDLLSTAAAPDARKWSVAREFGRGLLWMSAGQHEDMRLTLGHGAPPEAARRVAELKGGMQLSLYCRAAALLAGADEAVVDSYGEVGLCIGTAVGVSSDVHDLWQRPFSKDLADGKQTLPVSYGLTALSGERHGHLVDLLRDARGSAGAQAQVRQMLVAAGAAHYSALVIETYRRRALRALESGRPLEPAAGVLRSIIDSVSLVHAAADVAASR